MLDERVPAGAVVLVDGSPERRSTRSAACRASRSRPSPRTASRRSPSVSDALADRAALGHRPDQVGDLAARRGDDVRVLDARSSARSWAWMQLRPGPNRVGPWGMMQPAADARQDDVQGRSHAGHGRPADLPAGAVHLADLRDGHVRDHPVQRVDASGCWQHRRRQRRDPVHLRADVDRRLRHLARRLGVGFEVSAARARCARPRR